MKAVPELKDQLAAVSYDEAALTALNDWVHRFTGIVVPALSDRPDLLSMLGLKPRGGKR